MKQLLHAGLVRRQPRYRNPIYRADIGRMNALLAYLTAHCCEGQSCGAATAMVC